MTNYHEILNARIKVLCCKYHTTPAKVERDLDFGNGAFNKWARGQAPSYLKLIQLADYFGVSLEYLIGRSSK